MRTTLSINDELLRRAKARAAAEGVTLGHYVESAVREHLAAPAASYADVVLPVFAGGRLRTGIDPSSNRTLYDALDDSGTSAA